jgi:hypothetical protein
VTSVVAWRRISSTARSRKSPEVSSSVPPLVGESSVTSVTEASGVMSETSVPASVLAAVPITVAVAGTAAATRLVVEASMSVRKA